MKTFKFNMRIGRLEARSCGKHLMIFNVEHYTIKIVEWSKNEEKPYCWVVAYYQISDELPDLKFVGDRPFKVENRDAFWKLAEMSYNILNDLPPPYKLNKE